MKDIFHSEPAKLYIFSKCPEKYQFAWIFSLIFKSKGLALLRKASEKCVESWEQISTPPVGVEALWETNVVGQK